ncbi:hypothetical protein CC80DRAFT_537459 [Byssothecium circinans]|uniref:DUF6594 domain-containing protein n=1 Tax=Byssothecium circinans TaxID=147558 RepID=A0A6A5TS85_9PLEO|nr:hypothetical protein CC80DRAFT_537459 [Byssothecium circinans]
MMPVANANADIEMQRSSRAGSRTQDDYRTLFEAAIQSEVIYTDDLENTTLPLKERLKFLNRKPERSDRAVKVNLAALQRITLHRLQRQLLQKLSAITHNGFSVSMDEGRLDEIKDIMTKYCQAVRDWDLMVEYQVQAGKKLSQDLFLLSSEEIMSHATMADAGFDLDDYPNRDPRKQPDLYPPQRRYVNRDRSIEAFWKRLVIALFGGITLVGPMLIMELHKDQATALATTSVAVILFAICIATFSNARPEIIVSAVAAYAAVLVVFVGANQ